MRPAARTVGRPLRFEVHVDGRPLRFEVHVDGRPTDPRPLLRCWDRYG